MKVNDLRALLKSYNDDSEIEVEIHDEVTDASIDSTFNIGFHGDDTHPILTISTNVAKE